MHALHISIDVYIQMEGGESTVHTGYRVSRVIHYDICISNTEFAALTQIETCRWL